MAVDLEELVPSLRRSIRPPGSDLYEDVVDGVMVGWLSDSFWEGKLDGVYDGYTESDGVITPESGTTDLGRDWQSLIVMYAAMSIVTTELRATNTLFRAKAGPVEFETQNSAQLLRDQLRLLAERRDQLLELLSTKYNISPGYVDMVCARTSSVIDGVSSFDSGQRTTEFF